MRTEVLKDLAIVFSNLRVLGRFILYFRSDSETPNADHLCQSVPDLQRMKGELQQLAEPCSVWMPYRSKARPDAAFNPTTFAQPIAHTLSQV